MHAAVLVLKTVWLLAVFFFAGTWLSGMGFTQLHIMELELDLLLPSVMLGLSFIVFHSAPAPLWWIHHSIVGLALLAGIGGFVWLVYFPASEMSALGAYFLVWGIGAGYVLFLLVLLVWLGVLRVVQRRAHTA